MRKLPIFAFPLLLTSCVALVVIAIVGGAVALGTYKYVNNKLQRDYDTRLANCHKAAQRAVRSLRLSPGTDSVDFQKGIVQTRMADGRQVVIASEYVTDDKTRVRVRVGDFESDSNRTAARQIHEQIYKELTGTSEREP